MSRNRPTRHYSQATFGCMVGVVTEPKDSPCIPFLDPFGSIREHQQSSFAVHRLECIGHAFHVHGIPSMISPTKPLDPHEKMSSPASTIDLCTHFEVHLLEETHTKLPTRYRVFSSVANLVCRPNHQNKPTEALMLNGISQGELAVFANHPPGTIRCTLTKSKGP